MLQCQDLTLKFGEKCLFKNVNLNLLENHRYVLVGANGCGKSSFLKLLADEDHATRGEIEKPNGITIGLMKQDHFRYKDERILDVVIDGKKALADSLKEKAKILAKSDISEEECFRLAELEETILANDGYNSDYVATEILEGLGVHYKYHDGPLSALSGGYKLRVLLAQALFQNPHILLLDEPTNHLDIVSIQWLETFLTNEYKGLLIVISHDRAFINGIATDILDIDYETITPYPGNYEKFLKKKAEVLIQKEQEIAQQQQKIDSMQAYVDRFRAKASKAKQAQSRLKMIEKIEVTELVASSRIEPNFNFKPNHPGGKQVLSAKGLSKAFEEKSLFKNLNFSLKRGDKCAIIGPNGVGKSTLLKILLNELPATEGAFTWNEKTSIGYFSQNFHELLDPNQTLLEWLIEQVAKAPEVAIRKALGQMLFSGEAAYKKIKVLSGGECARLIFAKILLEKPNMLVLDEPTNHLDLETIEGLTKGLKAFPESMLFVSHNRFFVEEIATCLLVLSAKKIDVFPGTYHDYLEKMGKDYLLSLYEK